MNEDNVIYVNFGDRRDGLEADLAAMWMERHRELAEIHRQDLLMRAEAEMRFERAERARVLRSRAALLALLLGLLLLVLR